MKQYQTIWVHAWRSDSAGGFNWYQDRASALRAYDAHECYPGQTTAVFHFGAVRGETPEATTDAIDAELDHCINEATYKKSA